MTTEQRVKELMVELGLNVADEKLVIDLCIFYLKAQTDQIREQLEKSSVTDTLDTQTEYGVRKVTDNKESEVL